MSRKQSAPTPPQPNPAAIAPYVGGSFAPPFSDESLAYYREIADGADPAKYGPVKDAMNTLLNCCEQWWDLPEPQHGQSSPHPSGTGEIVPLEPHHADMLDEHIPWKHELEGMKTLFDTIDPIRDKELRNAASAVGESGGTLVGGSTA